MARTPRPNALQRTIFRALTENTGRSVFDSGDFYGRHWERNARKTIRQFMAEPVETFTVNVDAARGEVEVDRRVSLYHFLENVVTLDYTCIYFNSRVNVRDINYRKGKFGYGISQQASDWLERKGFRVEFDTQYTYNFENDLSQDIQYTYILNAHNERYVLLQVHNGCDARSGLTSAYMFYLGYDDAYLETGDVQMYIDHEQLDDMLLDGWFGEEFESCGETYTLDELEEMMAA